LRNQFTFEIYAKRNGAAVFAGIGKVHVPHAVIMSNGVELRNEQPCSAPAHGNSGNTEGLRRAARHNDPWDDDWTARHCRRGASCGTASKSWKDRSMRRRQWDKTLPLRDPLGRRINDPTHRTSYGF